MEQTTKMPGKNREVILLVLVALIGAAGLLALQFSRKTPAARSDERTMVQSGSQNNAADATASAPIQHIPGNLVTRNEEYPEVGQPFVFRMANFAQGAVYELDLGDGSGRKTFTNGKLEYVYKKLGEYEVTLYARYEGQEVKLQTIKKEVKVQQETQKPKIINVIQD